MSRVVSATEAKRRFSRIPGEAADGETVIFARRGYPVAQVLPLGRLLVESEREMAVARLLAMLEEGIPLRGGLFIRGELYDR